MLPRLLVTSLSAALALLLLAGPTRAQEARTLIDMQMWLLPGGTGYCAEIEAGTLSVSIQLVGRGSERSELPIPVEFYFYGYRGSDPGATMAITASSTNPVFLTSTLLGGFYCFNLTNTAVVPEDAGNALLTQYWQGLDFKMVLTPGV